MSDQPGLFDAVGKNHLGPFHRDDPPTAIAAAVDNYPRSGSQRARIFVALLEAGERGLTGFEASRIVRIPRPHTATTRIEELERMGRARRTDRTRPTDTGSQAIVWVAVP